MHHCVLGFTQMARALAVINRGFPMNLITLNHLRIQVHEESVAHDNDYITRVARMSEKYAGNIHNSCTIMKKCYRSHLDMQWAREETFILTHALNQNTTQACGKKWAKFISVCLVLASIYWAIDIHICYRAFICECFFFFWCLCESTNHTNNQNKCEKEVIHRHICSLGTPSADQCERETGPIHAYNGETEWSRQL